MVLTFDIGNTTISFGIANVSNERTQFLMRSRIASKPFRTAPEYAVLIREILSVHQISFDVIDGVAISSVVPELTFVIEEAASFFTHTHPLVIGPGVRTGLNIRVDSQTQLGADIVSNAVAALGLVPAPAVIVDMGTATTISLVDQSATLVGTVICPGLQISMKALASEASLLVSSDLSHPEKIIGKNTHDSVNSGVINGHALMIDGFVRELRQSFNNTDGKLSLIATGGLADAVIPYCRNKFMLVPELTLLGVAEIFRRNGK